MANRNFWITADVDGKRENLASGPRAKDGGMHVKLYQRDGGGITTALEIECITRADGTLLTRVTENGKTISEIVTKR